MSRPLAALMVCLLGFPAWGDNSPSALGRLFFTPEQRAALDRQRSLQGGSGEGQDSVTVNGIIQRNNGRKTVWINGVPLDNPPPSAGPGQDLRAGETINSTSGERRDLLNGGTLSIHSRPPASRK